MNDDLQIVKIFAHELHVDGLTDCPFQMNKWMQKLNKCRRFHTGNKESLNSAISLKMRFLVDLNPTEQLWEILDPSVRQCSINKTQMKEYL